MSGYLAYLLQVISISGLLYLYYHIWLRNQKFHHYNRYYLLATIVLSLVLPLINIDLTFTKDNPPPRFIYSQVTTTSITEMNAASPDPVITKQSESFNFMPLIYMAISFLLLLRLARGITDLMILKRKSGIKRIDDIRFIVTDRSDAPFSFFKWLFWRNNVDPSGSEGSQMLQHEIYHIRQWHSVDIIFTHVVSAICWLNPFFHIIRKELNAIHEFLADHFAMQRSGKENYADLLLREGFSTRYSFVNPFFHNQIKRRIIMITKSSKPAFQYTRKLMVLPLLAALTMLFSFSYKMIIAPETPSIKTETPAPAGTVIDLPADKPSATVAVINKKTTRDTIPDLESSGFSIEANEFTLEKGGTPYTKGTRPLLFIFNGQRHTEESLRKLVGEKTIKAARIVFYNPSQEAAIKKYGKAAEDGVIEFHNAILVTKDQVIKIEPGTKHIETGLEKPLFIVDGVEMGSMTIGDLDKKLPVGDISHITVLKSSSAEIKYGEKGKNGVIEITTKKASPVDNEPIFSKTEYPPSFPGGDEVIIAQLTKNLPATFADAYKGKYKYDISFVVNKDGSVSEVMIQPGNSPEELTREISKVFSGITGWQPAIQNKHKVRAYWKISLVFSLEKQAGTPNQVTPIGLREMDVFKLLNVSQDTRIVSFVVTMNRVNGDIAQVPAAGPVLPSKVKELFQEAVDGTVVTVENIKIQKEEQTLKLPSRVLFVKNQ